MSGEADRERSEMLARVLAAPAAGSDDAGRAMPASEEPQSLADVLNSVLDRGVVVGGDAVISVAGVDLVVLKLSALLTSVSTLRKREVSDREERKAAKQLPGDSTPSTQSLPLQDAATSESGTSGNVVTSESGVPSGLARPAHGSPALDSALAAQLGRVAPQLPEKLDIDPESVQRDLARLVLTIVELLRRVVEHQAVQRMDDPDLSDERIEKMGIALQQLSARMDELRSIFGLAAEDLNIDLGPLGPLL